jgi:Protein of unknown function DUF262/Protein of unknown function (DUF1524)
MEFSTVNVPLGLTARVLNLSALFGSGPPLCIPSYQRPYTWTAVEVAALMVDLLLAFERRAPYYFVGHIVLVRTESGELEVADGQQRLATFTMFLAIVRDHLSARADSLSALLLIEDAARQVKPRLRLRRADEHFFLTHVQVPGGLTRMRAPDTDRPDSQALMCQAVETIEEILSELTPEKLDEFAKFVVRYATFDVMIADERGGAAAIFPTMNTRGRSLSGPDILKQELLERSGLDEEGADDAALLWEGLEDRLGRESFSELVSEILPVVFTEEPLRAPGDLNALRSAIQKGSTPQAFLKDHLPRYGAALLELRKAAVKAEGFSTEVNRRVRRLMQLPDKLWVPPAVAFLADHRGGPAQIARFFEALERLALATYLGSIRADRIEKRYARIQRALADDGRLFAPSALALTQAESDALIAKFNKQHSREAGQRRIIVLWLNAALPGGEVLTLDADATVEHILPVRCGKDWHKAFPDPQERAELAKLLGNFVLITADKNNRLGNANFAVKIKAYLDEEDGEPIYALSRDLKGAKTWTPAAIRARHERLVEILSKDLGLTA